MGESCRTAQNIVLFRGDPVHAFDFKNEGFFCCETSLGTKFNEQYFTSLLKFMSFHILRSGAGHSCDVFGAMLICGEVKSFDWLVGKALVHLPFSLVFDSLGKGGLEPSSSDGMHVLGNFAKVVGDVTVGKIAQICRDIFGKEKY